MLLFIYKNILFTFPQVVFGIFNLFTAQSIHDDLYVIFYNLIFTAFAVGYVGVMDRDIKYLRVLPKSESDKNKIEFKGVDESVLPCRTIVTAENIKKHFQYFYYITQKRIYFSWTAFSWEMFNSVIQGLILTLIPLLTAVVGSTGRTPDLFLLGVINYSNILFAHIICILLRVGEISWPLVLCIVGTCLMPFYIFAFIYDQSAAMNPDGAYSLIPMHRNWQYYLVTFLCLFCVFLIEFLTKLWRFFIKLTMTEYGLRITKNGKEQDQKAWRKEILKGVKKIYGC